MSLLHGVSAPSSWRLEQVEGHDISFPWLLHPCAYCFDSLGRAQFEEATSTIFFMDYELSEHSSGKWVFRFIFSLLCYL